jgi:DNA-binding transcriptional LysR family regulator
METHVKLTDVRAFCAIVEQGSITAAARVLAETKGSVSRRLARLENVLSTALVHRSGGKAVPTALGRAYYRSAGEGLEVLDAAAEELRDQEASPKGHLRVTALPGVGPGLIAEPIGRFIQAFPGVTIELLLTERVLSFREDHIDFAFRPAMGQLPDSTHKAHRLGDVSAGFVASPSYLEAHGTPQHPRELEQHRLLLPPVMGQGMRLVLRRVGEPSSAEEFELRGHLLSHDTRLLREVALAGGGITLLVPDRADPELERGGLSRLLPDWESPGRASFNLLHPAGPMAPKARAFKDFIKQDFATHDPLAPLPGR